MIRTDSRQEFETQFASTRLRICFGERMRPACWRARPRSFSQLCRHIPPFEEASFGATPKLGHRGERYSRILFGQFAKPVQSDGGLRIVGFVPAVERAHFYPLKSGAFD